MLMLSFKKRINLEMKAQFEAVVPPGNLELFSRELDLPSFDHGYHYHPEVEITWIGRSRGVRMIGDHSGSFEAGDLYVLGVCLPHLFRNSRPPRDGAQAEVLQFSLEGGVDLFADLSGVSEFFSYLEAARQGFVYQGDVAREGGRILRDLRVSDGAKAWSCFFELADVLSRAPRPEPLSSVGFSRLDLRMDLNRMHKVCAYLLDHFSEPVRHEEMAALAHLAPASFSRAFRAATGKTYSDFLNDVRVGHACRLLLETDLSITDIAFASGFQTLSNFNRRFRVRQGCTPRDYRRQAREAGRLS